MTMMPRTTRQQMIQTMEYLPDEAIEEIATFFAYLQYKYVIHAPVVLSENDTEDNPVEAFLHTLRQIQQGPWESTQTSSDILSAMRR